MDSRLGQCEEGRGPSPLQPKPLLWPLCIVLCSPGLGTGAQPHCEVSLHASQGLAHHGKAHQPSQHPQSPSPHHQQQGQLGLWLWGVGGGGTSMNPKPVRLAAKPTACGCQGWFCGQCKAWNGFSCIFLHQRDKLLRSPFVLTLLLHSPYLFLIFWSPGNFYDDYDF